MAISVVGGSTSSSSAPVTKQSVALTANTPQIINAGLGSGVYVFTASTASAFTVKFYDAGGTALASYVSIAGVTSFSLSVSNPSSLYIYAGTTTNMTIELTPSASLKNITARLITSTQSVTTTRSAKVFAIGGGGGGGYGGGGSGYFATGTVAAGTYTATIGAGGGSYGNGGTTSFSTVSAAGGFAGGQYAGGNGGSGGGGGTSQSASSGAGGSNGASGASGSHGGGGTGSGVALDGLIPGNGGGGGVYVGVGGGTYAGGSGGDRYSSGGNPAASGYGGGGGGCAGPGAGSAGAVLIIEGF